MNKIPNGRYKKVETLSGRKGRLNLKRGSKDKKKKEKHAEKEDEHMVVKLAKSRKRRKSPLGTMMRGDLWINPKDLPTSISHGHIRKVREKRICLCPC